MLYCSKKTMKSHIKLVLGIAIAVLAPFVWPKKCRTLQFRKIATDNALANHTVRTIWPISGFDKCVQMCYMDVRCYNVNLCKKADSSLVCNLLASEHAQSRDDLIEKQGCIYYSSQVACSSSPCPSNATCEDDSGPNYRCICPKGYKGDVCDSDIDECLTNEHKCHVDATCTNNHGSYKCMCKSGFYGDGWNCRAAQNCDELNKTLTANDRVASVFHLLKPRSAVDYNEFCSYDASSKCGVGTWRLAMKIDGSKDTFSYDSKLWSNKIPHNMEASKTGLDEQETKTSAFWDTPLKKMCLGMKYGGIIRWITIDITDGSLYDVMTGSKKTTQLQINTWKSLLPDGAVSLQKQCTMQGFNLDGGSSKFNRKIRLGYFSDNSNDCGSYSAYIGLGASIDLGGFETNCGNFAIAGGSDNGDKNIKAICYILLQ